MIHVGIVTTLLIKAKHGPVAQKYKHVDIFTSICTPGNPDQRDVCPTLSFVFLFFVLCVFLFLNNALICIFEVWIFLA